MAVMPMALLFVLGCIGLLVLLVVVLGIAVIFAYNKLVGLRNRYRNAYAQIDVQLKRRYDLIPNLVETVKGYLSHERGTLEEVIRARNTAVSAAGAAAAAPGDPKALRALMGAEAGLAGVMTRFMAVMEQYPNLKADQHISRLMEELTSTENRISFARQAYNDSVMVYNTQRETFPTVAVAGMLGFQSAAFFEVTDEAQREAPQVKF